MVSEKFIEVDGLRTRYLENGRGSPVLLLHGATLGSSADVWTRNIPALAERGFRAIAFDQPGFGLSDNPEDHSVGFRRRFVPAFMDALKLEKACLIGHSQSGRMALDLAFAHPQRVAKVIALGTGSLLPPLPEGKKSSAPREGDEGGTAEPTLEDTRRFLEANLFDHALITPAVLEARQRMSVGKNFQAFLARRLATHGKQEKEAVPSWQRPAQAPVPLLMIYGKQDRGAAAERAALARQHYPRLDLHVLDRCKHLVQWDAAAEFVALSTRFLTA